MKNTIESAKDFLTKYRDERTHPVSVDYFAEMMVSYAASVQKEVVVPSESWLDGFETMAKAGSVITIEKIKYMNPDLTFIHNEK